MSEKVYIIQYIPESWTGKQSKIVGVLKDEKFASKLCKGMNSVAKDGYDSYYMDEYEVIE